MSEAVRRYETARGSVSLRPERASDEAFLFSLLLSHAGSRLQEGGIPAQTLEPLMRMQFAAQTRTYRTVYPNAVFSIIEADGVPIGRLIEEDEGERVYFVDFALLPVRRAQGLGTAFIEIVADEWGRRGRAARVEVRPDNVGSLRLCEKLGFARIGEHNGHINLLRAAKAATE
ncbi:MAG: GNAT family N-acetyltransferase [Alphaproteobacteria bacterium]|nr:GNAT family N-acetyltransferase [Alphaproteobacteria bacterium]MBV9692249.1 GNAT family N-acetyltransferase [Alphaproteobacteria bacterium]